MGVEGGECAGCGGGGHCCGFRVVRGESWRWDRIREEGGG